MQVMEQAAGNAVSGDADALYSGLAELLKELKSKRDDEGKPRVKEADSIAGRALVR